jgi:hypothetical protein
MKMLNTNAYWDNDFDRLFDEAIEELEKEEEVHNNERN